jgi:hypothetical protein
MRKSLAALSLALLIAAPAIAAEGEGGASVGNGAPLPLVPPSLTQPLPTGSGSAAGIPPEDTPGFQAIRPMPQAAEQQAAPAPVTPAPPPAPVLVQQPAPAPEAPPAKVEAAPRLVEAMPPPAAVSAGLSGWVAAGLVILGGLIAGLCGAAIPMAAQRREAAERRRMAASTLALELETRRQAFEAVPVPPNAEAGVSFVSAVAALGDLDGGWRAMQGYLYLLPEKLTSHLSIHYAAVRHVSVFVRGQSFAAGLRMLQANRIGGHPCPDAAAMRESHVELAAAFRGVDKMVQGLRALS